MFQDVCERGGLDRDWVPRDLRYTFVWVLSDDGMAIEKIARLAGHASNRVTETVYRQARTPAGSAGGRRGDGPALRQRNVGLAEQR
jgi:integrase